MSFFWVVVVACSTDMSLDERAPQAVADAAAAGSAAGEAKVEKSGMGRVLWSYSDAVVSDIKQDHL